MVLRNGTCCEQECGSYIFPCFFYRYNDVDCCCVTISLPPFVTLTMVAIFASVGAICVCCFCDCSAVTFVFVVLSIDINIIYHGDCCVIDRYHYLPRPFMRLLLFRYRSIPCLRAMSLMLLY